MSREEQLWREIASLKRQLSALRNETGLALRQANRTGRTIFALYQTNTQQTLTDSDYSRIDFEDKVADTHDAVTTGASWVFTCPAERVYLCFGGVKVAASTDWGLNELAILWPYKNGAIYGGMMDVKTNTNTTGGSLSLGVFGGIPIQCVKGDTIAFFVYQNSGNNRLTNGIANNNWCAIVGI